jgi:hypothetical protein
MLGGVSLGAKQEEKSRLESTPKISGFIRMNFYVFLKIHNSKKSILISETLQLLAVGTPIFRNLDIEFQMNFFSKEIL